MSPNAVPPKVAMTARPVAAARAGLAPEVLQVGVGDGPELLEVVLQVELVFVDRLLADDGVEEVAVRAACGRWAARRVAFGIDQDVAVGVRWW